MLTRETLATRVERHCSHIIELSPRESAGHDYAANEGVRIFTVKRVSGSFLGIKLKSVRTRSCRSRIAAAKVARWVLAALAFAPAIAAAAQAAPGTQSAAAADASGGPQVLCRPQVIGYRRIPPDSVLARIASHQGDPYDAATVERDFNSLWNTGYFEKMQIERADTPSCVQLVIYVREKPTIRSIDYTGDERGDAVRRAGPV